MMKTVLTTAAAVMLMAAAPETRRAGRARDKGHGPPEKATVGSLLDYRINIAGKGLAGMSIVPPEKREFYPERKRRSRRKRRRGRSRPKAKTRTRRSTFPSI